MGLRGNTLLVMKKIVNAIRWFFSNHTCVFWLGMAIVLLATTLEVVRGRNTNYFDYQDSTRMFWRIASISSILLYSV